MQRKKEMANMKLSKYFTIFLVIIALQFSLTAGPAMAGEKPTIGVIVPTLAAQFWNNYVDFMKTGAKELGVDLVVLNADNKPDQMVKGLEDLVARGVDGIIFTPYWATAARGLTLAKQANIPVILTDTYADFPPQNDRFPNYVAFIGPSDADAGYQMAKTLFAKMSPGPDGKKIIGVVNGTAGTSVAIDRNAFIATHCLRSSATDIDGFIPPYIFCSIDLNFCCLIIPHHIILIILRMHENFFFAKHVFKT